MSIFNLQPDNILTQIYEEKKDTHSTQHTRHTKDDT